MCYVFLNKKKFFEYFSQYLKYIFLKMTFHWLQLRYQEMWQKFVIIHFVSVKVYNHHISLKKLNFLNITLFLVVLCLHLIFLILLTKLVFVHLNIVKNCCQLFYLLIWPLLMKIVLNWRPLKYLIMWRLLANMLFIFVSFLITSFFLKKLTEIKEGAFMECLLSFFLTLPLMLVIVLFYSCRKLENVYLSENWTSLDSEIYQSI